MAITIQGDEDFRKLLLRPFLTLGNFYICLSSLQSSYPPLSRSVKFLGLSWGSPFLYCVRTMDVLPMPAHGQIWVLPSSPTGTLSMPTPLTLLTLYMLDPYGSSLQTPFTPLLILLFLQWEDRQRWDILLSHCMLIITLICGQLQILL